jgi:ribosomal protein S18 acetylase RimI-like enzyme
VEQRLIVIQDYDESFKDWAEELMAEYWSGQIVVSRGRVRDASQLPGFVAVLEDDPVGLLTYEIQDDSCELVTLNALRPGVGIGSLLIQELKRLVVKAGWARLWLITTNDNIPALRFYQRHGFVLAALHREALVESRRLKPQIPETGIDGIPIRDELEFEWPISPRDPK